MNNNNNNNNNVSLRLLYVEWTLYNSFFINRDFKCQRNLLSVAYPSSDGQVSLFFIKKNKTSIIFHFCLCIAWTTAAVDNNRVIGLIPIVLDMVNLRQVNENMHHTKNDFHLFFYSTWKIIIEYVHIAFCCIFYQFIYLLQVSCWMDGFFRWLLCSKYNSIFG